jgi:hypothetical protein
MSETIKKQFLTDGMAKFGFDFTMTFFKLIACLIITVVTIVMLGYCGNSLWGAPGVETYNTDIVAHIFQITSMAPFIIYFLILGALVCAILLNVARKEADIPLPPVEELSVDTILLTLTGGIIAIFVMMVSNLYLDVAMAVLLLLLPVSRLIKHVSWWCEEFPQKKVTN